MHGRVFTCILGEMNFVFGSVPELQQWCHYRDMSVFSIILSEGLKNTAIHYLFSAFDYPLYTDICSYSLKLFMILCTVHNKIHVSVSLCVHVYLYRIYVSNWDIDLNHTHSLTRENCLALSLLIIFQLPHSTAYSDISFPSFNFPLHHTCMMCTVSLDFFQSSNALWCPLAIFWNQFCLLYVRYPCFALTACISIELIALEDNTLKVKSEWQILSVSYIDIHIILQQRIKVAYVHHSTWPLISQELKYTC